MKKKTKLFILLLLILFIPGCAKYEGEMIINKDKSMDIKFIYAVDKNYVENDILTEKQIKDLEINGYEMVKYNKEGKVGYTIKKSIDNIDNVSSPSKTTYSISNILEENVDVVEYFQVDHGLFKDTYKAIFEFNMDDCPLYKDMNVYDNLDEEQKKTLNLTFKVTLPSKAISNNATNVDKKTLTWDLTKKSMTTVEFEFGITNGVNIFVFIITIIAILVLIFKTFLYNLKDKILSLFSDDPAVSTNFDPITGEEILTKKQLRKQKRKEKRELKEQEKIEKELAKERNKNQSKSNDDNPFKGMFNE